MKTHIIKTSKAELLIIELPKRTADFSVINTGDRIAISAFDEYDNCLDVMPISTDYTLLGKPDEIGEENTFFSLIESEVYWKNPYDKSGKAEEKTFDRNRSVIFKKSTAG